MTAVFADTAYYVALLSRRDEYHASAYAYTARFAGEFVTTAWVNLELANHLSASSHREAFVSFYNDLNGDSRVRIVPATQYLFERGLDLFACRPDKVWSLTDCISFVVMQEQRLSDALTADHHFAQAGFRVLLNP